MDDDQDALSSAASDTSGSVDDWDDELGDIDDLSDPESDLEDSLPVATAEAVPGKQEYLDSCAAKHIIPVSAFIKSMGQSKVSLRHYLLGDQGATAVADALKMNTTIQSLDLSGTWLGVVGAAEISEALKPNVTMEYLDVSDNRLGLHGGQKMSELLRDNETLRDVCLSGNKLCDRVAKHMAASLMKHSSLTRLDLSHNDIGDSGGAKLAELLLCNDGIKDLDLSWNRLTHRAGIDLAGAIENNSSLTVLDIGWNGIGDEAGKALEDALTENDVLRHLNLSNNRLSSVSASSIAAGIKANKGLVSLVLDKNPFGARGCDSIMEALKENKAIINVGLRDVEGEANFGESEPPPAGAPPPAKAAEDGIALAPPKSPRTLLTPRQVWARNPEPLQLPCEAKPTGYFKLNLSKPWERLAAERLAAVDPLPDIMPLAKIRPNLAQGKDAEPFDLKKNASSMPDSGELQVTFQMMHVPGKHAPRQRVEYTLNMAEKKDQEIAKNLRLKVCELMHDAFALNPKTQKPEFLLDGRPFEVPLNEDPKWQWPSAGTVTVVFVTPSLVYQMPFSLDLAKVLDRAVAEFLLSEVVKKEDHSWVDKGGVAYEENDDLIEQMLNGDADDKVGLPNNDLLTFKHQVSNVTHLSTQHYKLNLAKEKDREEATGLSQRDQKSAGINVVDATLDNAPYTLKKDAVGAWQLPSKGVFEFDLVTLEHKLGKPASHSDVLKVEESLHDLKSDAERMKELTKSTKDLTARGMHLLADQAKKLIECFEQEGTARVTVLKLLLPKIIAINDYDLMRGCV